LIIVGAWGGNQGKVRRTGFIMMITARFRIYGTNNTKERYGGEKMKRKNESGWTP
jgi:hypothetical protein